MATEGAPSIPSCGPPVPTSSSTASPEGDSSEQIDSTASSGNMCSKLAPESSFSSTGTGHKPVSAT
ncbi:hypothetical protein HPB50_024687 [Hyalomma asiaticum]|uniref:Uncharacterized protein n=1 Tax=Hyalomma asiaticum TaxID=266040 RepID=A0ACB7S9T9_HYAAI|nr:hypothetical protein HPB50_024687 [Hyalomma asiaticum]